MRPSHRPIRRYPRIRCEAPLYVEQLSDGDFSGFSRARVLGEGGCMFPSPRRVGYLSLLKLSISIGGRIVNADGRVAYERWRPKGEGEDIEVGIEFLRLTAADRAFLRGLCAGSAGPA